MDCGGEINVENGTFNPVAIFHNVATVGLDSLRSICPNIALETPVASASRERLQPRCWRSCLSVVDKSERDFPCDSSGKTEVYQLRYNGQMLRCLYAITHEVTMRLFSIPPPTLLAGFLAVLIGYASSAAIIWQAAIVAEATTAQISGWMTALGLAMGVSTLTLTLWYRVPVLTAWSTPGAALLVTGLQGLTLNEAIGVFIVTNALIAAVERDSLLV